MNNFHYKSTEMARSSEFNKQTDGGSSSPRIIVNSISREEMAGIHKKGTKKYFRLLEENRKLKAENEELKEQVFHNTTKEEIKDIYRRSMELKKENGKLKEILDVSEEFAEKFNSEDKCVMNKAGAAAYSQLKTLEEKREKENDDLRKEIDSMKVLIDEWESDDSCVMNPAAFKIMKDAKQQIATLKECVCGLLAEVEGRDSEVRDGLERAGVLRRETLTLPIPITSSSS